MNFSKDLKSFYNGKRVLITGIHGFKGAWLAQTLLELGAQVYGYGLERMRPEDENADKLFNILQLQRTTTTINADITNKEEFESFYKFANPDVVLHLAAQPLVSLGYEDPLMTFNSNVMGTATVLNTILKERRKKTSVVSVTTDKVYRNLEKPEGYKEDDELKGYDPYSNSKSCAELVSYSFNQSFFIPTQGSEYEIVMSTARAGNVIGGGDFSDNRIIPDIARAMASTKVVSIRNLEAVRPYQHVLDAVIAYAIIAMKQYDNSNYASEYNIGPNADTVLSTKDLLEFFVKARENDVSQLSYEVVGEPFVETTLLLLDSNKYRKTFGWIPTWGTKLAILSHTYSWYSEWVNEADNESLRSKTIEQIGKFLND